MLFLLLLGEGGWFFFLSDKGPDPRIKDNEQQILLVAKEVDNLEAAYENRP